MCKQARRLAGSLRTASWLGAVLVLAILTLFVFTDLRRFNLVEPPWPYDGRFTELGAGGWEVIGEPGAARAGDGVLRLRLADPARSVTVRRVWRLTPEGPLAFRVAATVAAEGVAGGRADISFAADQAIGRSGLPAIHQLVALHGSRAAARYVSRFEFPSGTREVELAIRLHGAAGELRVQALEIKALEERWLVRAGRTALQVGWAVALAVGCWLFWRGTDSRRTALVLAAAAGSGLVLLLLPQGARNAVVDPLAALVPGGILGTEGFADLGHFVIFAVAGFLVRLSRRRDAWWRQLVLLVVLAGLTELLQFLAELRAPTVADWLTNLAGALAGWVPAMLWLRRQEGQLATQRRSSTTLPPQAAKQSR